MSDESPYWLEPSFNPNKATRVDLRRWLSKYDTPLPSTDLKKDALVTLFQQHIGSKRETLLRQFHSPVAIAACPTPTGVPSTPGPPLGMAAQRKSLKMVSTDEDDENLNFLDIPITMEFPKKVQSTPSVASTNSGSERTTPRAQIKPTPSPNPPFHSNSSLHSSATPSSPTPPASSAASFKEPRSNQPSSPGSLTSRTSKNTPMHSPSPSNRKGGVYFSTRSRPLKVTKSEVSGPKQLGSSPETAFPGSTIHSAFSPSLEGPEKSEERRNLFSYPSHTLDQARRNSKNFFNLTHSLPLRTSQKSPTGVLQSPKPGFKGGRPSFFGAPSMLWSKTYDFLLWCGKVGFLFLLSMMVLIYFHSRNTIGYCDQPFTHFSDQSIPTKHVTPSSNPSSPPSLILSSADTPSLFHENHTSFLDPTISPWLHHLWSMIFPLCIPCPMHAHCAHGRAVSCPEHYVLKQVLWNRWHCAPDTERRKNIDLLLDHLVTHLQVEAGRRICEDSSEWFSYAQVQQFSHHLSEKLWRGKKDATLYHAIVIGELFTQPIEAIMVNNTLVTARYPTLPWKCSLRRVFHHNGPHLLALLGSLLATLLFYLRYQHQSKQQRLVDRIVHYIVDLLIAQDRLHQEDPSRPSFLGIAAIRLQVHSTYARETRYFDPIWRRVETHLSENPNVRWRTTKHKGEMVESWEWIGFDSLVSSSSHGQRRTQQEVKQFSARDPIEVDECMPEIWKDAADLHHHTKRSSTI